MLTLEITATDTKTRTAPVSPCEPQETQPKPDNKTKENNTSCSYSHQIRSKGSNAEQRRPRMAADWIKIPASRQLNNLKEPTWVLIILLPSESLTNSLLTLQMAVMQEGCLGNACHRLVFTGDFGDQGKGLVQSGVLSSSPRYNSCCLPTVEQY